VSPGGPQDKPAALRLFFALWPCAAEQQAMAQASAACVAGSGGRPIPSGNLHVTLAFLGNVETARLPQLRAAVHGLAAADSARPGPLRLQFQSLEHWARPQILCVTANAATPDWCGAFALATGIKQAILAAGFAPDLKPFRAHVTVARKVARAPPSQPMTRVTWNFDAFALVASTTAAAGSAYSVLESYPLDRLENAHK
jgi:RNA 2',3'-cyclic 3'-phosphodiesterase